MRGADVGCKAQGSDVCFQQLCCKGLKFRTRLPVKLHTGKLTGKGTMEGPGLKKKDLKRFREVLLTRRREILRNAQRTLREDMTLDTDDLADEMDLSSSEYLQSFTFRLRGREKTFLAKIDHALERIENGSFGLCEQCEEPISIKRLEARLETTLCIRCKEDQERQEKAYG